MNATSKNPEISLTDAAARLGLTVQSAGMWAKRPGAPARADGRHVWVRWPDFARWREAQLIESAMPADVDAMRSRKLAAEAGIAELQLAREQRLSVSVADYETAIGAFADRFVSLMRALPVRVAHLGEVVETHVEAEVELIIGELNAIDVDVLPELEAEPSGTLLPNPPIDDAAPPADAKKRKTRKKK